MWRSNPAMLLTEPIELISLGHQPESSNDITAAPAGTSHCADEGDAEACSSSSDVASSSEQESSRRSVSAPTREDREAAGAERDQRAMSVMLSWECVESGS